MNHDDNDGDHHQDHHDHDDDHQDNYDHNQVDFSLREHTERSKAVWSTASFQLKLVKIYHDNGDNVDGHDDIDHGDDDDNVDDHDDNDHGDHGDDEHVSTSWSTDSFQLNLY